MTFADALVGVVVIVTVAFVVSDFEFEVVDGVSTSFLFLFSFSLSELCTADPHSSDLAAFGRGAVSACFDTGGFDTCGFVAGGGDCTITGFSTTTVDVVVIFGSGSFGTTGFSSTIFGFGTVG